MEGLKPTPELLGFAAIAGVAALGALGVVMFKSPVRSALSLVVNFFMLAFLYFTLNAEMLGITQVVVYAGAIMVLFLFVIMLLNLSAPQLLEEKKDLKIAGGLVFGFALFGIVSSQLLVPLSSVMTTRSLDGFGAPQPVGRALFTLYAWPFEVASVLLLVGIVGSILLAKRKI